MNEATMVAMEIANKFIAYFNELGYDMAEHYDELVAEATAAISTSIADTINGSMMLIDAGLSVGKINANRSLIHTFAQNVRNDIEDKVSMWRTNDELATKLILMVQDMILPNFLEDREIIALKCKVADTMTEQVAQPMMDELVPVLDFRVLDTYNKDELLELLKDFGGNKLPSFRDSFIKEE